MDKKYILLNFTRFREYSKFGRIKFINVTLMPPPFWRLKLREFDEPTLFQDKEVFGKFKSNKITKLEYEMTYRYKLRELKQSGWLDDYIDSLNASDEYDTVAFMYTDATVSTVHVDVLANYLHDNYNINFNRVESKPSAINQLMRS